MELFVQATKQQANPSVYYNRFFVFLQQKCTKTPKGNSSEEVWAFQEIGQESKHLNSPQKHPLTTTLKALRFLRVNDLLGKSEALQVMVWKLGGFP